MISRRGRTCGRRPIGNPNGQTHERKKEQNDISKPNWNPVNNPYWNPINNHQQQELARIDNHRRIEEMARYEAIMTDAETQAVVDGILSSSFGGDARDYGLADVIVRYFFFWGGGVFFVAVKLAVCCRRTAHLMLGTLAACLTRRTIDGPRTVARQYGTTRATSSITKRTDRSSFGQTSPSSRLSGPDENGSLARLYPGNQPDNNVNVLQCGLVASPPLTRAGVRRFSGQLLFSTVAARLENARMNENVLQCGLATKMFCNAAS